MTHLFEQITKAIDEAEWASILITILIAILLLSFITVNIVSCVCQISMKKSLKKLANQQEKQLAEKKPEHKVPKN